MVDTCLTHVAPALPAPLALPDPAAAVAVFLAVVLLVDALVERVEVVGSLAASSTCFRWEKLSAAFLGISRQDDDADLWRHCER